MPAHQSITPLPPLPTTPPPPPSSHHKQATTKGARTTLLSFGPQVKFLFIHFFLTNHVFSLAFLSHDDDRHHRREQLLAGTTEGRQRWGGNNDEGATTMRGRQRRGGEGDDANEKKAQETSPTSLGPSVSFFAFISLFSY
jgi:hypothetical protein